MPVEIEIHVLRAEHLPLHPSILFGQPSSHPNPVVKITAGGRTERTTRLERTTQPSWINETFKFTLDESSEIEFQVKHKGRRDRILGGFTIAAGELLKLHHRQTEVTHPLTLHDGSQDPVSSGSLTIAIKNLSELKTAELMQMELVKAQEAVKTMKSPAVVKYIISNTLSNMWSPLEVVFTALKKITDVIEEIHPYAYVTCRVLSVVHNTFKSQMERDKTITDLLHILGDALSFVQELDLVQKRMLLQKTVIDLGQEIQKCAEFIHVYASKSFSSRLAIGVFRDVDPKVSEFQANLERLRKNFDSAVNIQTLVHVTEKESQDLQLALLPAHSPSSTADFLPTWDTEKTCLGDTRHELLTEILDWASNTQETINLLWLSGGAGTGKTVVAHTVTQRALGQGILGGCFFFSIGKYTTPDLLFRFWAYQLVNIPMVREKIHAAVRKDAGIVRAPIGRQFLELVLLPLQSLPESHHPILLVIDALDECSSNGRNELLPILERAFQAFPSFVRVLITARRVADLDRTLSRIGKYHEIKVDGSENRRDVRKFIELTISQLQPDTDWPGADRITSLCAAAGGLFIWASTAYRYIKDAVDYDFALDQVLKSGTHLDGISGIYEMALSSVPHWGKPGFNDTFRKVMGCVLASFSPLTATAIDQLLGLSGITANHVFNHLIPVLSTGIHHPITILHPSFFRYITDSKHCKNPYYINLSEMHPQLSLRCIEVMTSMLQKDICNLGDKYPLNSDIPLGEVAAHVPPALHYACQYWVTHVSHCPPDHQLCEKILHFLEIHLLHWIETRSLLNLTYEIVTDCRSLLIWVRQIPGLTTLGDLVYDAERLLQAYGGVINKGSVQVYPALAMMPHETKLYKHFSKQYDAPFEWVTPAPKHWSQCLHTLEGHNHRVNHVAFSSDDARLASASSDETVRLWDAQTGAAIGEPLSGHTDSVNHVAFSPDGVKLASASSDHTVRLWDAQTGAAIGGPLRGHTHSVNHVTFSSHGARLASASFDHTVRLWDAQTGAAIGEHLRGHTGLVVNVAFSSDGDRLASASSDHTIRLWDAQTGAAIGEPLRGHTNSVNHVSFSSDGARLASASSDHTVRLWDAETGAAIGESLRGHTNWVNHVGFSSDGARLASASDDHTVRLWDAQTGAAIGEPLRGHTHLVMHVAFSSDGARLASASDDHTIRLWDAQTGAAIGEPLKGHTDWVRHVAFSSDGARLASVSFDHTVRLWDAQTGAAIGESLRGHTHLVNHVAFSSDGARLASASSDETVRLWDAQTGAAIGEPLRGHIDSVNHITFSSDGARLASASSDHTVRLWDAQTGAAIGQPLTGNSSLIPAVLEASSSNNHVSEAETNACPHSSISFSISFDPTSCWISSQNIPICQVEPSFHNCQFAIHHNYLALGTSSGEVAILKFNGIH